MLKTLYEQVDDKKLKKEIEQIILRLNPDVIVYDLFDCPSIRSMLHSWIIQSSGNTYKPSKPKKKKKKMKDPQNQL